MLKRIVYIPLVALAVIFTVVSSVMPHHHHGSVVCLGYDTEQCCSHRGHDTSDGCHDHGDCRSCAASIDYYVADRGGDAKCKIDHDHHGDDCCGGGELMLPVLMLAISEPLTPPERIEYGESDNLYISVYVDRINGLRAPPVV